MNPFISFLLKRLPLHEVSEYFPRRMFNDLFSGRCKQILATEKLDDEVARDLTRIKDMDLVGYVDSSLRRSGVQGWQLDEVVHDLLVGFVVNPATLFKTWDRKSPMSARLKVAIKNSLITLSRIWKKRAKRFQELPNSIATRPCTDFYGTIEAFRDMLRSQFGDAHVRVFDVRVAGNDIKGLIGSEGVETSYKLKRIVGDIKKSVIGWGDECLQRTVASLVAKEEETLRKRFGRKEAVRTPE
jgi:hypothetical protein